MHIDIGRRLMLPVAVLIVLAGCKPDHATGTIPPKVPPAFSDTVLTQADRQVLIAALDSLKPAIVAANDTASLILAQLGDQLLAQATDVKPATLSPSAVARAPIVRSNVARFACTVCQGQVDNSFRLLALGLDLQNPPWTTSDIIITGFIGWNNQGDFVMVGGFEHPGGATFGVDGVGYLFTPPVPGAPDFTFTSRGFDSHPDGSQSRMCPYAPSQPGYVSCYIENFAVDLDGRTETQFGTGSPPAGGNFSVQIKPDSALGPFLTLDCSKLANICNNLLLVWAGGGRTIGRDPEAIIQRTTDSVSLDMAPTTVDFGVHVEDSTTGNVGHELRNASVTWTVIRGKSTFSSQRTLTDQFGNSDNVLIPAAAGDTAVVVATIANGKSVAFTVYISPASNPVTSLVAADTVPAALVIGSTTPVAVRALDAAGHTVSGVTIDFGVSTGGGSVSPGAVLTDGNGMATANWTVGGMAGVAQTLVAYAVGYSQVAGVTFTTSTVASQPFQLSAVSAFETRTCGITVAPQRAAYCWGIPPLGNGSTSSASAPVKVAGSLRWLQISVGADIVCGVTAGTPDALYCWGKGTELGIGATTDKPTPVQVPLPSAPSTVVATNRGACALLLTGDVYCWGDGANLHGELGNGTFTLVTNGAPSLVVGGYKFATLTGAADHYCGKLTTLPSGTSGIACWGENGKYQLGNGTQNDADTPTLVAGSVALTAVSAGALHGCALADASGSTYCWGWNAYGEVGDGSTSPRPTPVRVSTNGSVNTIVAATHGAYGELTCAINSNATCWGNGNAGDLGDNSTTSSSVPVTVQTSASFVSVTTADSYACGLTSAGAAYCWGANIYGQLGTGNTTSSSVPAPVAPPMAGSHVVNHPSVTANGNRAAARARRPRGR